MCVWIIHITAIGCWVLVDELAQGGGGWPKADEGSGDGGEEVTGENYELKLLKSILAIHLNYCNFWRISFKKIIYLIYISPKNGACCINFRRSSRVGIFPCALSFLCSLKSVK